MTNGKNRIPAEVFLDILTAYCKDQKTAKIVIDREGIEEIYTKIKEIDTCAKVLRSRVTLPDETGFNIDQIISIDNIFRIESDNS